MTEKRARLLTTDGVSIDGAEAFQDDWRSPAFRRAYWLLKPRYEIVRQVAALRRRLGITQQDLAKRSRTHQSRISKIESGEYDLRLSTLVGIADALGADVSIKLVPRQDLVVADVRAYIDSLRTIPVRLSPAKPDWQLAGAASDYQPATELGELQAARVQ